MRWGSAAAALVAAAVLVSPAVPGPLGEPTRRLSNTDGDGPDPHWDRPVDGAAIRRAGDVVPDDAGYFLDVATDDPVLRGNLKAAGQLFLAPALPLRSPQPAAWVVRYADGRVAVVRGRR